MLENVYTKALKEPNITGSPLLAPKQRKVTLVQCPHCGMGMKALGLGAHKQSLRCMAGRFALEAKRQGYTQLNGVRYNPITSAFSKRFPSYYERGKKKKRSAIHNQVWYETWFAKLYNSCLDWTTYYARNTYGFQNLPAPIEPVAEGPLLYDNLTPFFEAMAVAKRKNDTKGIDNAVGAIELLLEKHKQAQGNQNLAYTISVQAIQAAPVAYTNISLTVVPPKPK